jgi:hypothetical protein
MRWAVLVLGYLNALIWPGVVLLALAMFRDQVGSLILNAKRVSAFGAEAEFAEAEIRISALDATIDNSKNTAGDDIGHEHAIVTTIRALVSFDFDELDSVGSVKAAVLMHERLEEAVTQALHFFNVPNRIMAAGDVGQFMQEITGVVEWSEFINLLDEQTRKIRVLRRTWIITGKRSRFYLSPRIYMSAESLMRRAKLVSAHVYRLARMLPVLVENSLSRTHAELEVSLPDN